MLFFFEIGMALRGTTDDDIGRNFGSIVIVEINGILKRVLRFCLANQTIVGYDFRPSQWQYGYAFPLWVTKVKESCAKPPNIRVKYSIMTVYVE
jgi:hypothetical protein